MVPGPHIEKPFKNHLYLWKTTVSGPAVLSKIPTYFVIYYRLSAAARERNRIIFYRFLSELNGNLGNCSVIDTNDRESTGTDSEHRVMFQWPVTGAEEGTAPFGSIQIYKPVRVHLFRALSYRGQAWGLDHVRHSWSSLSRVSIESWGWNWQYVTLDK